jgi:hypothetical protein
MAYAGTLNNKEKMKTINALFPRHAHWLLPLIVVTSYFLLALLADFRTAVPELLGITAVILIMLYVILYAGEQGAIDWSPNLIILIAVIIRIPFLFRPPELSDDIYRYLWDGMQLLNGYNPYSLAPSSMHPQSAFLLELRRHVNHPELVTIYPPAAQLVFIAGAALHKSVFGIKAVLIAMDLLTCLMIIRILKNIQMPVWRSVLYAWNPLTVIETAASGHIDSAGPMFLFFAFLLLMRNPSPHDPVERSVFAFNLLLPVLAGFSFSFALLIKLLPVIFLPGFVLFSEKRGRLFFLSGFIAGIFILSVPFLPDLKNMLTTLGIYTQHWEFSGLGFRLLRKMVSSGDIARYILAITFMLIAVFTYTLILKRLKSSSSITACNVIATFYTLTLCFLFLTPTLHPWYVLYLVCFLPFTLSATGLVLSWSIFFAYYVVTPYFFLGKWIENDYIPALIWVAPLSVYLLTNTVRMLTSTLKMPHEK